VVFKKIIFILFLLNTVYIPIAFSGLRCDLLKRLEDPIVKENSQFWKDYSQLAQNNHLDDKSLSELLSKYKTSPSSVQSSAVPKIELRVETSKRAQKEIKNLPTKAMRKNFEEFVDIMNNSGIQELYKNPSRWHAEKINAFAQGNVYTVRLNSGYRVLFKFEKNELTIMEVNAGHIHSL
jgi:mRNA-degrading endonuclease RelE of RelBE toxin-antitoxin system